MHINICTYIRKYAYLHTCMHICTHTGLTRVGGRGGCIYAHIDICIYIYVITHTCMHACIYAHARTGKTYTGTHTRTYAVTDAQTQPHTDS